MLELRTYVTTYNYLLVNLTHVQSLRKAYLGNLSVSSGLKPHPAIVMGWLDHVWLVKMSCMLCWAL